MTRYENKSFFAVILTAIGWPLVWGTLLCVAFYALLHNGVVHSRLLERYFAGHPVEYIEAWMFGVGVAALAMKALNVMGQFGTMDQIELTPKPAGGQTPDQVGVILEGMKKFPRYVRDSYLVRRLEATFSFVFRKGSSAGLEEELKHQADLDAVRQSESYALVRMIVWATPMLGFLGTVIGITLALGDLSPQSLVATPEKAMEGLLAGLSVAFDTTAVALSLSIVLMFGQFLTNQMETALLEAVDERVNREMIGRFGDLRAGSDDPQVQQIHHMSQAILQSIEDSVERQAEVWNQSLQQSQEKWDAITQVAGTNISHSLETAFRRSLQDHAHELTRHEQASEQRSAQRWEQLQSVLSDNTQVVREQQVELVKQADLMLQSINAAGEVSKLQHALNENLRSLTMLGKFDEAVMSLSAAIHLLNARLGAPADHAERVRIHRDGERRAA